MRKYIYVGAFLSVFLVSTWGYSAFSPLFQERESFSDYAQQIFEIIKAPGLSDLAMRENILGVYRNYKLSRAKNQAEKNDINREYQQEIGKLEAAEKSHAVQ